MKTDSGYIDPRIRKYILPENIVWHSDNLSKNTLSALLSSCLNNASPWVAPGSFLKNGDSFCLDFGKEIYGGIKIITGKNNFKVHKLKIRFGESISETMNQPSNDHVIHDTIIDIPSYGTVEFGNTGFRFVRIDVISDEDTEIELKSIQAIAVFRNLEYKGNFECNNMRLNKIWQTGAYTVHLNMQNYVWDGIKRDQLVWLGDMHPEMKVICSVFDDDGVLPKSLDFAREQSPIPKWINDFSSYSLWWIIIQKDWFLYKGNFNYLCEQKNYLIELLNLIQKFVDEQGNEILPAVRFLDWQTNNNEKVIHAGLQALLIWALESGEFLCKFLNEKETAESCNATITKLKKQNPDADNNKQANALKCIVGLESPGKINDEILKINPYDGISTFYGYYVIEARAKAGDYIGAIDLIKKYWGGMIDMGATTFWEDFEIKWMENATGINELPQPDKKDIHKDFGNHCYKSLRHSLCHGWAGGPTAWLSEHVLGFKPLEPGCKKLLIEPHLADLEWAKGALPTPYGVVTVSHKQKSDGKIETQFNAPGNIEVILK